MKLKKIYVENYGNLSGRELTFGGGLTEILGENGYGKTTVASFIRAMFYGLPSSRANSKEFDDRQHFYPFGGGRFGGSVVFEFQGAEYRIERFFDKKSDTRDECVIYRNGEKSDIGTDAGRFFFGLDEDSFARTLFMRCDGSEISSTAGINAKLNNFVADTDDDNNFDTAVERLTKKQKEYKSANSALDERIKNAGWEIKNMRETESGLQSRYVERNLLKEKINALTAEANINRERRVTAEKWKSYDKLLSDAAECEAARLAIEKNYAGGIPDGGALKKLERAAEEMNRTAAKRSAYVFGEDRERELQTLRKQFQAGIPDGQRLKDISARISETAALKIELSQSAPQSEDRFKGGAPSQQKVAEMRAKAAQLGGFRALSGQTPPQQPGGKKPLNIKVILSVALGGALLIAGLCLLLFTIIVGGVICLISGILVCGAGGFIYLKDNLTRSDKFNLDAQALPFAAQADGIEAELINFLSAYGFNTSGGVLYDFAAFESSFAEHEKLLASQKSREEELQNARARLEEKQTYLRDFFVLYGEDDEDFNSAYLRLNSKIARLESLEKDYAEYCVKSMELTEKYEACKREAEQILSEYSLAAEEDFAAQLKALARDAASVEELCQRQKKLNAEAESYARANSLSARPDGESGSGAEQLLREKEAELVRLDNLIASDELTTEQLPQKLSEVAADKERLAENKRKYSLLGEAISCLKSAESTLRERYVAPIKNKFCHYSDKIERVLGEKIVMDKNYRISFESGGSVRSDRHLSAGQRDICSLCLRLALIDNMYEKDAPFVVLDDPFVNLDEKHMKDAAAILKELAADRQIIYLTCHPSRSVQV